MMPASGGSGPTHDLESGNVQRSVEQRTNARSANSQHLPVPQFAAVNPLGGGALGSRSGLRQRNSGELKRMLSGGSSEKTSLIPFGGSRYWLGWKSMDSQWRGWQEWNGWSEDSSANNSSERGTPLKGSKGSGGFGVNQPSYMDLENPEPRGMPKIPTASSLVNAEESGADPVYPSHQ